MRREAAKLMEIRAIVQAIKDQSDDGKATQDAFNEYQRALMPHLESGEKVESQRVQEALAREFAMGPMAITGVQQSTRVRSRLRRAINQIKKLPRPSLQWQRRRIG